MTQDTRFTLSRNAASEDSEEGDCADRGASDGEGGAILRKITGKLVMRPLAIPANKGGVGGREKSSHAIDDERAKP